jgi:hypothetical protein
MKGEKLLNIDQSEIILFFQAGYCTQIEYIPIFIVPLPAQTKL